MKRVLIVKLWALGDIIMATPMLAALRASDPDIHVTWVIEEESADLLRGHPLIDEVHTINSGKWRRLLRKGNIPGWLRQGREMRRQFRRRQFDAVINCHPDKSWTSILCPAPIRVALYPGKRADWTRFLYTKPIERASEMHDTRHYLLATQALGCPDADLGLTLGANPNAESFLQEFESQNGMDSETEVVALSPFSSSDTKNWPLGHFAAAANNLARRNSGIRFVITFAPKERTKAESLADLITVGHRPIVLPAMTLWQYLAILRRASVVVSGDSSPLHIAAAVGTPFVTMFGPTDPARLAPLKARGKVLVNPPPCAPCWSNRCHNPETIACMKAVSPEQVVFATEQFLRNHVELTMHS